MKSEAYQTLVKYIQCQHGRLTIDCLDKIIHSCEAWEGSRGCINSNLKKNA